MFKLLRGETEKIIELNEYGIILRRKRDGNVDVYVRYDGHDEYISDSVNVRLKMSFTDLCEHSKGVLEATTQLYSHPSTVVNRTLGSIQSYCEIIYSEHE